MNHPRLQKSEPPISALFVRSLILIMFIALLMNIIRSNPELMALYQI